MKKFFIPLFSILPLISIGQGSPLRDSINQLLAPEYALSSDSFPPYHMSNSLHQFRPPGNKATLLIVEASNTEGMDNVNKIFIMERRGPVLKIIDTTPAFEVDGRGPGVQMDSNNLTIFHGFHLGESSLTYRFSAKLNRYILSRLLYVFVKKNYPNNAYWIKVTEAYNVQAQKLMRNIEFFNPSGEDTISPRQKIVFKKIPPCLGLNLSQMQEPCPEVFAEDNDLDKLMRH